MFNIIRQLSEARKIDTMLAEAGWEEGTLPERLRYLICDRDCILDAAGARAADNIRLRQKVVRLEDELAPLKAARDRQLANLKQFRKAA